MKKLVYFVNQQVSEYWRHDAIKGWQQIDKYEAYGWNRGTFDVHHIRCSDDQFDNRSKGCIKG